MWDPQRYLAYAEERARPFHDLLARVDAADPASVVDLGCGPGTMTALLAERWPLARVVGIDSSPAMLAAAAPLEMPGRLEFRLADLRDWRPERPVDVLVSNATLQWVPQHLDLLPALVGALARGGHLAVQVPGNVDTPSHTSLRELRMSSRWRAAVGADAERELSVAEPTEYVERLAGLGCSVDAWETTYLHILHGEDAVLEWMSGSALRPVLDVLEGAELDSFLSEYAARLREAFPRGAYGTVLPFRRIFVVARRTDQG